MAPKRLFQQVSNASADVQVQKQSNHALRVAASRSLKQLEYRSYLKTIDLYHYSHAVVPIEQYRSLLSPQEHGFVFSIRSDDRLTNPDGTPRTPVPEGDETPEGFIEVAYLRGVFQNQGCALGFRHVDEGMISWLCFDRPLDEFLDTARNHNGVILFDKVAELPRGLPGEDYKGKTQGYPEHKDWFYSLEEARHPGMSLFIVLKRNARRKMKEAGTISAEDAFLES